MRSLLDLDLVLHASAIDVNVEGYSRESSISSFNQCVTKLIHPHKPMNIITYIVFLYFLCQLLVTERNQIVFDGLLFLDGFVTLFLLSDITLNLC